VAGGRKEGEVGSCRKCGVVGHARGVSVIKQQVRCAGAGQVGECGAGGGEGMVRGDPIQWQVRGGESQGSACPPKCEKV